jgi:uncharacterized cupin superfamily protein
MTQHLAHWDEAPARHYGLGPMGAMWQDLGKVAGSVNVGVRRVQVDAGRQSTPVHVHDAEEEIFFILRGSGFSWQGSAAAPVRAGDCIVHAAGAAPHTLIGGDEGIDALVFGTRVPVETCRLPRAGVAWLGRTWIELDPGEPPWQREVAAGVPDTSQQAERNGLVLNVAEATAQEASRGDCDRVMRDLAGQRSYVSGLRHMAVAAGKIAFPPHVHTAEEEVFVVLAGEGELELWDCRSPGSTPERLPLRSGSVVCRPAGSGVAHALRGGEGGMTYLAYGERSPLSISYYPRSNKISLRGAGVIGRLMPLDYWDGEE